MKLMRTAKIKLNQSFEVFKPTFEAYTKAYNYVCQIGFPNLQTNGVELHKLTYTETRKAFMLIAKQFELAQEQTVYLEYMDQTMNKLLK
jgi:predicted transposase